MSKFLAGVLCAVAIISIAAIFMPKAETSIPPTPAFSTITIGNHTITAHSYDDHLTILLGNNLAVSGNGNTVTLSFSP